MVLAEKMRKRHPLRCLFCVGLLFIQPVLAADNVPDGAPCLDASLAQNVTVARVTDGDTVVLDDERRVRLIGFNTLELNTPDEQDKAMALLARQALQDFLQNTQASSSARMSTTDMVACWPTLHERTGVTQPRR